MITEERIAYLESKILEQEKLITELFQAVINQQQMINDRTERQNELQLQYNSLAETVLLLAKR